MPAESSDGNEEPATGAQPPEEKGKAKQRELDHVAAGLGALASSLKFTLRETGLTRGLGDWLKVNQKDGFDCQSCAWPSPDEDRNVFEFCENGVKALTSEATRKQITPEFFREHSIADLQTRTDYWLELQGRLVHPMIKRAGGSVRGDGAGVERAAHTGRSRLLHERAHEQRSRLSLPAFCQAIRDEQPARLLEHVPRIERSGHD
jgi:hypothetical protein